MPPPNEARTRKELIDPALRKAGWDVTNPIQVGTEIPVDGFDPQAWKRLEAKLKRLKEKGVAYNLALPKGISDYALYRPNGETIAIVEAKRTSTAPRLAAEAQAEFYVTEIAKRQSFPPFAFLTNGHDIHFWDVGQANPRLVQGFFSPLDLENLLYLRQNKAPLTQATINTAITNRAYQLHAIRRVAEVFEQGKRKALIVMATGTGKTRVAMSLVEVFLRSNWARRILFVADRDALVDQALTEGFQAHIPDEPGTRIYSYHLDISNRLYVVTLQTLSNCFQQFTPAFFDLIIFDEVHRSIFNKWNEVLTYFDARMIGLTATPADFIDRNTFNEFECFDGVPTFLYSLEEAIREGYLVDFDLYQAQTQFQRQGIRGVDLSEEQRNALTEQGIEPDELDFAGTDLEVKVSNRDTLRKQWEEIRQVCLEDPSGLPGKTIVFAMTQAHAERLREVFEEMYPQPPGLARVITSTSEYRGTLLDKFKKENLPRIAISVDMLETGVNVPEVVNLVFMRPIQSPIKLAQMIGRGTRNQEACLHLEWLPEGRRDKFLIIDFWENNFNKDPQAQPPQSLPVLVSLFNTRLKLLALTLNDQQSAEAQQVIAALRAQIAQIPTDSYSVKRDLAAIAAPWQDAFWRYLTENKLELLRDRVGPLLRYVPDVDVFAATFTHKVERLKLQCLSGQDLTATIRSIAEDVDRLPQFVFEDSQRGAWANFCLTPQRLQTASPTELNRVIEALADQMKNMQRERPDPLKLDLLDSLASGGYIILTERGQPIHVEKYRQLVDQRVLELVIGHPVLEAIARGEVVSDSQLLELERTLRHTLGGADLYLTETNIRRAYPFKVDSLLAFLRYLLGLEGLPDYQDIVRRQFADYIARHPFNADQIRFLRAVENVFVQKRRLEVADLYDPPFSSFGQDAVERWFSEAQVEDLLAFVGTLEI